MKVQTFWLVVDNDEYMSLADVLFPQTAYIEKMGDRTAVLYAWTTKKSYAVAFHRRTPELVWDTNKMDAETFEIFRHKYDNYEILYDEFRTSPITKPISIPVTNSEQSMSKDVYSNIVGVDTPIVCRAYDYNMFNTEHVYDLDTIGYAAYYDLFYCYFDYDPNDPEQDNEAESRAADTSDVLSYNYCMFSTVICPVILMESEFTRLMFLLSLIPLKKEKKRK